MKLNKRLKVNGELRQLASEMVILELNAGGRATFVIQGDVTKGAMITLDIGYQEEYRAYFDGFASRVQPAQNGYTKVIARERSGLLAARWPVSIQHPTASEVLEQLSFDTGLHFVMPEQDYMTKRIPNFTSQGSGYQLLDNLGRAFEIEDFCWYQQSDGNIYVGSFTDSRWANRETDFPESLTTEHMGGQSMKLSVVPSIRPGAVINGNRITQVHFENTETTLYWKSIVSPEKRKIHYLFPELAAGHHLPRLARVEAITDQSQAGHENNPFRPRYGVDVQLLDEDGKPDLDVPIYKAVPLPTVIGGAEQGQFATPSEGSIVEIAFAYGRSDRPFIRTILGDGWSLPTHAPEELLTQQRHEVFERTDAAGNHIEATDQERAIEAYKEIVRVEQFLGEYGNCVLSTTQHSVENIGGRKLVEALGSIEMMAGDDITLGSLANMHLTSGGEWVQIIGKLRDIVIGLNDKLTVLGERVQSIEKDDTITIGGKQTITIGKDQVIRAKNIYLNGELAAINCGSICPFTGKPHVDGSSTVFMEK
ncbi:hypothetical protein R6233_002047 [Vibrio parahaemolyticus]|uniref:hypothetical protein n=1 Tax=Vibrio parahaemolyticus TaxID=670 RepID=UPI0023ECB5EA|nr:hypothetical protein [Vibrio parahaemolyticus]ELS9502405.1 hypothetical protein [Vibrio parahaemolyticus]MBE3878335.1 hypothetical protein [Vibrio parahaemolyticus]MBE5114900.1 hypothetical protein [Vibrio parahaemolyticus]MDF5416069.1 hypothetical protein [Vibrio parahaemolyticus]